MKKLAERMVHPPDPYTFRRRFIDALRPPLSQRVLESGYNPEQHELQQIYSAAKSFDEAKRYNAGANKSSHIVLGSTKAINVARNTPTSNANTG